VTLRSCIHEPYAGLLLDSLLTLQGGLE